MLNKIAPNHNSVGTSEVFKRELEIAKWNYKKSVEFLKPKVEAFKNSLDGIARELFIARQALCRPGATKGESNQERYTFMRYLSDVGLSYKMAQAQIALYDPVTDRIKTPEEFAAEKVLAPGSTANLLARAKLREARIAEFFATGNRPDGWDNEYDEPELLRRLEQKKFAEITKAWLAKPIETSYKNRRDYFAEAMASASNYSSIRLENQTQSLAQAQVCQHLHDYLLSFTDPEVLMSAAYNIGLRVRDLVNDVVEGAVTSDNHSAQ